MLAILVGYFSWLFGYFSQWKKVVIGMICAFFCNWIDGCERRSDWLIYRMWHFTLLAILSLCCLHWLFLASNHHPKHPRYSTSCTNLKPKKYVPLANLLPIDLISLPLDPSKKICSPGIMHSFSCLGSMLSVVSFVIIENSKSRPSRIWSWTKPVFYGMMSCLIISLNFKYLRRKQVLNQKFSWMCFSCYLIIQK